MRLLPRPLFAVALLCLAAAGPALAEGGASVPPIDNPVVQKECGACHMAYAPQMLPMRSWQAIMGHLGDHFGENATLPASDGTTILAYLVAHAGDAPGTANGRRFMRGIPADATPLRCPRKFSATRSAVSTPRAGPSIVAMRSPG